MFTKEDQWGFNKVGTPLSGQYQMQVSSGLKKKNQLPPLRSPFNIKDKQNNPQSEGKERSHKSPLPAIQKKLTSQALNGNDESKNSQIFIAKERNNLKPFEQIDGMEIQSSEAQKVNVLTDGDTQRKIEKILRQSLSFEDSDQGSMDILQGIMNQKGHMKDFGSNNKKKQEYENDFDYSPKMPKINSRSGQREKIKLQAAERNDRFTPQSNLLNNKISLPPVLFPTKTESQLNRNTTLESENPASSYFPLNKNHIFTINGSQQQITTVESQPQLQNAKNFNIRNQKNQEPLKLSSFNNNLEQPPQVPSASLNQLNFPQSTQILHSDAQEIAQNFPTQNSMSQEDALIEEEAAGYQNEANFNERQSASFSAIEKQFQKYERQIKQKVIGTQQNIDGSSPPLQHRGTVMSNPLTDTPTLSRLEAEFGGAMNNNTNSNQTGSCLSPKNQYYISRVTSNGNNDIIEQQMQRGGDVTNKKADNISMNQEDSLQFD